jgi:hypothetical protein
MAIDTAARRNAALMAGGIVSPDGTLDANDRGTMLDWYCYVFGVVESNVKNLYLETSKTLTAFLKQSLTRNAYVEQTKSADMDIL